MQSLKKIHAWAQMKVPLWKKIVMGILATPKQNFPKGESHPIGNFHRVLPTHRFSEYYA